MTISIQAPWGGGKTSLMRMIQKKLDPLAVELVEKQLGISSTDQPEHIKSEDTNNGEKKLSLRQVLNRISLQNFELPKISLDKEHRLTIWFNVWKYESLEQVWAGLADTIIRGYAKRLNVFEREKFWLYLHMKRLDADKIRLKIYDYIASTFWNKMLMDRNWIVGSLALFSSFFGAGLILQDSLIQLGGLSLTVITLLAGALKSFFNLNSTLDEKAELSIGEFMRMPNYSKNLGFVHYVEQDLRNVFEAIPSNSPLVCFIDDLDRCSPKKVAEIVEAINLFLAGDFPNTMFVLGMDTEIVAAALEEHHDKIIARLKEEAGSSPVGRRFMNKFVQLPFLIPPLDESVIRFYASSLLSAEIEPQERVNIQDALTNVSKNIETIEEIEDEIAKASNTSGWDEELLDQFRKAVTEEVNERIIDKNIEDFTDKKSSLRRILIDEAANNFRNPRETKRFINLFRFLHFINIARRVKGLPAPNDKQLINWVILSIKWPGLVRWLKPTFSGVHEKISDVESETRSRLMQLEEKALQARSAYEYVSILKTELTINTEKEKWASDLNLWSFMRKMQQEPESSLANASGTGLW